MEKPKSRGIAILRANLPQSVRGYRGNVVVAASPILRFRYTEERIYPGDGIYAIGWSSSEPSVASDPIEEPMEAIEDHPSGEIEDAEEETEADELDEEAGDGKSTELASWLWLTLRSGRNTIT